MDEAEARAVAQLLAETDGGVYVVPHLIARACELLPGHDWAQLVADADPAVSPPATLDRLRAHHDELIALAAAHGITGLRWDPERARLIGTLAAKVTYIDMAAFEEAAARLVVRSVPLLSDGATTAPASEQTDPL